jgi:hypothetical protein
MGYGDGKLMFLMKVLKSEGPKRELASGLKERRKTLVN